MDLNPLFSDGYNNLGNVQKLQQKLSVAEQSYRKAIEISPCFSSALNNLGVLLQEFGRITEGAAFCQRAIQIQPDFFEAHNALGIAYYRLGEFEQSEKSYRSAIFLKPDSLKCITTLDLPCKPWVEQRRLKAAIKRRSRSRQIWPKPIIILRLPSRSWETLRVRKSLLDAL